MMKNDRNKLSQKDWNKNENGILTDEWSCRASRKQYEQGWPNNEAARHQNAIGNACFLCVHYAAFNSDWGLCANSRSRHFKETIWEHFVCEEFADPHVVADLGLVK